MSQYDEYAFLPNYPAILKGQPPRDKVISNCNFMEYFSNFNFSTRHHKLVASTFTAFKLSLLYLISNDCVSWKQFISFVKTYALTFDPLLAFYHEGDHLILRMCSLFIYLTHISYLFVL